MDKTLKNAVVLSGSQQFQVKIMNELDKAANELGTKFTEYGHECVVNAMAALVNYTRTEGCELSDFDANMVRLALQNVGLTELNMAAYPSECYFDIRKLKNGKKSIKIYPQGAGNEKLVRQYGVNVKELLKPWIIHEGDEFTLPYYNGLDLVPPTFRPKFENLSKKVIAICYPVKKHDGTVEYLIADRESVKANVVAQYRQNKLYEANKETLYAQINKDAETMNLDQLLNKYEKDINPTYTSAGSRESMIIRKMKNNALKAYPREYNNTYTKLAVEDMNEDRDDSLIKRDYIDADPIERVENEIEEKPSADAVPGFEVGIEPPSKPDPKEQPTPKEESRVEVNDSQEETDSEDENEEFPF